MFNVLISDGLAKEGQEILKASGIFNVDARKAVASDELKSIIGNYDAIIIRSATKLTKDFLDLASKMKLIVRAGEGVDNVDVEYATSKKIHVMNTPGANNLAVAELAVGMMYSLARNIPYASQTTKEGKWEKSNLTGTEVTGKTLSIIGMGKIGRMVAERAKGIGMKVVGFDPLIAAGTKVDNFAEVVGSIEDCVSKGDYVTVHVPKNKFTANLINKNLLEKFKNGAYFINTARGGIAVEADLIEALNAGKLSGVATDVFEVEPVGANHPLANHAKVVCTPHVGASSKEAQLRVALMAGEQLVNYFKSNARDNVLNKDKF